MKNHNHASPIPPRPETLDVFLERHDLTDTDVTHEAVQDNVAIKALVSRLSQEEAKAERAAIDVKTGVLSETGFQEFLNRRDKLGRRVTDILPNGTLVIFADLDELKKINDSLGHKAGNQAIIAIAHALKSSVREQDIVARGSSRADEFVAVVDLYTEDAEEVQKQIVAKAQENLSNMGIKLSDGTVKKISASMGVKYHEGFANRVDIEKAMEEADAAMYEHKRSGKRDRSAA